MRAKNPNIQTWMPEMPYAYLGNCTRGINFNCASPPWDDPKMRSAINYLMDRNKIVTLAYEGANYTAVVPYPGVKGMVKVFEDLAPDILEKAQEYTYNPDKAAEILQGKGYAKNDSGFWEKDGQVLGLVLQTWAGNVEIKKVGMAQVELLQQGGVDAVLKVIPNSLASNNLRLGQYEAMTHWPCGSTNEPYSVLDNFHCRHVTPIGERAGGLLTRWCNEEFSAIVDEMAPLGVDDPRLPDLWRKAMDIYFEEMPFISQVESPIIMASNTTYWTNWPTADNPWFQYMIHWTCSNIIWEGLKKSGA
jgi:peptide/nickel transport system substrate-binding protein